MPEPKFFLYLIDVNQQIAIEDWAHPIPLDYRTSIKKNSFIDSAILYIQLHGQNFCRYTIKQGKFFDQITYPII